MCDGHAMMGQGPGPACFERFGALHAAKAGLFCCFERVGPLPPPKAYLFRCFERVGPIPPPIAGFSRGFERVGSLPPSRNQVFLLISAFYDMLFVHNL